MELKNIPIAEREKYDIDEDCKLNATAGAGKTTQILRRSTEGIDKYDLDPDQYTFCTYRTELAEELYQELQDKDYIDDSKVRSQTFIGTIHGICRRLLKQEGELSQNTEFVTETHKKSFCEQHNIPVNNSKYEKSEGEEVFEHLSYLYNICVDPHKVDIEIELETGEMEQLGDIDTKWTKYKENNNLMEFDELVQRVEELNLTPPNRYLVIDEMHDVYPLLHNTINRWIQETKENDKKTVIVAGDPRQVINSHQGTKPDFFLNKDLPEITIPKTYRCPEEVWDYAQSILDSEFDYQHIQAHKDGGKLERINRLNFTQKQGYWEVTGDAYDYYPSNIVREYNKYGSDHRVMFLVRARHQIPAITAQLDKNGIIYDGQHEQSWTQSDRLLDLFNCIQKLLSDIQNTVSKDEVYALYHSLDEEYASEHINLLQNNSYGSIDQTISDELQEMKRYKLFTKLKINEYDLNRLQEAVINYNTTIDENEISVDVRTIHESKGMQAETVVLFDSITNRIHTNITESNSERENECKTWFVGASRSSKNLFIMQDCYTSMHQSPFLPE